MIALKLENLSKYFNINSSKRFAPRFLFNTQSNNNTQLWALKNINLEAKKGECVGIIGENGSGKSTLLKILAGITTPSEGKVKINGQVGSFLELGIGFQGELSGRENILFYGSLLGLKKEKIKEVYNQIVEFSELNDVIEQPIRTYSSGMLGRLAFSVISFTNPDILLLDEIVSVGDYSFRQKSLNKLFELKRKGKTIIIVSHDAKELSNICDKCALLEKGKIKMFGDTRKVVQTYLKEINEKNKLKLLNFISKEGPNSEKRVCLYNELGIILESMIKLEKDNLIRDINLNCSKENYEKLVKLYEERIEIIKKVIEHYKTGNQDLKSSLILHKDLIGFFEQLTEIYEIPLYEELNDKNIRKINIYREKIKFLKEAIQIGKLLGDRKMEKLYERLAYAINETLKGFDENEKKEILLEAKRLLEEGLEKESNLMNMFKFLIVVTEDLSLILQGNEKYAIFEDLKNYIWQYSRLSGDNRVKGKLKSIIKEQTDLAKQIRIDITPYYAFKKTIEEQIKKRELISPIKEENTKNISQNTDNNKLSGPSKSLNEMLNEKIVNDTLYYIELLSKLKTGADAKKGTLLNSTIKEIIQHNINLLKERAHVSKDIYTKELSELEKEYQLTIKKQNENPT